MHVIVATLDDDRARTRGGVLAVLLLGELYGHGPWLAATVEVRGSSSSQAVLFAA